MLEMKMTMDAVHELLFTAFLNSQNFAREDDDEVLMIKKNFDQRWEEKTETEAPFPKRRREFLIPAPQHAWSEIHYIFRRLTLTAHQQYLCKNKFLKLKIEIPDLLSTKPEQRNPKQRGMWNRKCYLRERQKENPLQLL